VGDFFSGFLVVLATIVISAVVVALLCFDRGVYVPAYRIARWRFRFSALAAFTAAVAIEGAVAGSVILAVRHHARPYWGATPASSVVIHRPRRHTGRRPERRPGFSYRNMTSNGGRPQ
jgi:hypothetical protein